MEPTPRCWNQRPAPFAASAPTKVSRVWPEESSPPPPWLSRSIRHLARTTANGELEWPWLPCLAGHGAALSGRPWLPFPASRPRPQSTPHTGALLAMAHADVELARAIEQQEHAREEQECRGCGARACWPVPPQMELVQARGGRKDDARAQREHQRRASSSLRTKRRRWPKRGLDGWGEAATLAACTMRLTWADTTPQLKISVGGGGTLKVSI